MRTESEKRHKRFLMVIVSFVLVSVAGFAKAESLTIPATTAYFEPDSRGLRMTGEGVTGWSDSKKSIVWFGWLGRAGDLTIDVQVKLKKGEHSILSLAVSPVFDASYRGLVPKPMTLSGEVTGTADPPAVSFGTLKVKAGGYYRFELKGKTKTGSTFGEVRSLNLDGEPVEGSQFNLTKRRNAASVHLWFPVEKGSQVQTFYSELTVDTVPLWSYYMACGFHRGYFGIQVNSPTERRIIFSVWDSGNEGVDRNKVKPEDRVQLLGKGEGVVAHGFGNEGTGGHSHQVYNWKRGETYRFAVTAQPEGKHTIFSGWFFFPEKKEWGLIASFRAPKDGGHLRGLYSFSENFVGHNGHLRRRCEYGNQWVRLADGKWKELTSAQFTHDGHGREHRKDYDAGSRDGAFYLQHGGFSPIRSSYGKRLKRPASESPPEYLKTAPRGFVRKD